MSGYLSLNRRKLLLGTTAIAAATAPAGASTFVRSEQSWVSPFFLINDADADKPPVANNGITQDDAVDDGKEPPETSEEWQSLLKSFLEQYSFLSDGNDFMTPKRLVSLPVNYMALRVDRDFSYKPDQQPQFNHFRIETLMNQVADLLDRCLALRKEWEENCSKAANLFLDVIKFLREQAINDDEIKAGLFTTPYVVSKSSSDSNMRDVNYYGTTLPTFFSQQKATIYSDDTKRLYESNAQLSAILPFADNERSLIWNGKNAKLSEHAKTAALVQSQIDWGFRTKPLDLQYWQTSSAADGKKDLQVGLGEKAAWDRANIDLQKRRAKTSRELNELKIKLAATRGGSLNYAERMQSSKQRFAADFSDALDRYQALKRGLQELYSIEMDEAPTLTRLTLNGNPPTRGPNDTPSMGALDEYVMSTRNAIGRVLRLNDGDQQVFVTKSVRDLVGEDSWTRGIGAMEWKFSILEEAFLQFSQVRIRGILVFAEGMEPQLLSVRLTPPKVSTMRNGSGKLNSIDQAHLPACSIGDVSFRESRRPPNPAGGQVLYNASPLGEWQLRITGLIPQRKGNSLDKLDDLVIEWQVAAQAV